MGRQEPKILSWIWKKANLERIHALAEERKPWSFTWRWAFVKCDGIQHALAAFTPSYHKHL